MITERRYGPLQARYITPAAVIIIEFINQTVKTTFKTDSRSMTACRPSRLFHCHGPRPHLSITVKPITHLKVFFRKKTCRCGIQLTAASVDQVCISELSIFKALDTLRPTATGLDRNPPPWFLRLGADVFCKPLAAYLFNQSIASSFVPPQWIRYDTIR